MFDESEAVRDSVKFSELPEKQQKEFFLLAMQVMIPNLIAYLKEPLYEYLKDKDVKRDLVPADFTAGPSREVKCVPSPAEVSKMIRQDAWWAVKTKDPENLENFRKSFEAMEVAEKLVRIVMDSLDRA
jgi:hypothetical protein